MNTTRYLNELTILYAEDDETAREEVLFSLEPFVKEIVAVTDGKEALEIFPQLRPNIILTDIQMPNMNGIDLARAVREIDQDIPIVITTAFNDSDYLLKAIEVNITAYETKPIDLRRLLRKLEELAKRLVIEAEHERMQTTIAQYQRAIEESTYIVQLNENLDIVHINERLADLLGIEREKFHGKPLYGYLMAETAEEQQRFEESAKSGVEWHGELVYAIRTPFTKYFHVTLIPMREFNDPRVRFTLFMQDVTELIQYRKLLQNELSETKYTLNENIHYLEQYQKIIDEATAVCCFTPDGKIQKVDHNFETAIDASRNELLGASFYTLCEGVKVQISQAIEEATRTQSLISIKTRCKKPDSEKERIANSIFKPIYRLDGKVEEIVSVHQDITELIRLNEEITDTQKEILFRLGEVAENHSKETGLHVKRVSEYSKLLAQLLGLEEDEIEMVAAAAPMHDIGKLTIPDHILNKPGKLTPEEFEVMKTHALKGAEMFGSSERPLMKSASIIAAQHHENYDGTGYPFGLKGEEIHIFGRIVALSDVFDALSVERIYKPAWPQEKIQSFIRDNRGKKFDPHLTDLFLEHIDRFTEIRHTYIDEV
jgi:PAS domain S-box-containing protein